MSRQDLFDAIAQVAELPDTQALDAIVAFVAEWLEEHGDSLHPATDWREEMA